MNTKKITDLIKKQRIPIVIFWLLFSFIMLTQFTPYLFEKTRNEFSPPNGSDAARGIELQETYFPEMVDQESHVVLFHAETGLLQNSNLQSITFAIVGWLDTEYNGLIQGIAGYYIFEGTDLDYLKGEFISQDLTTSFLVINAIGTADKAEEFAHEIREFIHSLSHSSLEIYVTGFGALSLDTNESIESDLARIDSITIPLVFIVLVILLRNWRYFPVTLAPILMSLIISFGLLERYITLSDATIQSFVPSVMISLTLGIGVDYNLFLLTRFREERLKGKDLSSSLDTMMEYAGHTVFTSGLTLVIAMAGLAFFPISVLYSVGIAITMSIFVLLLINLTFTPAILSLFGNWIERERTEEEVETTQSTDPSPTGSNDQFGRWYRIGKRVTKYNKLVLLGILLVTLPLSLQLLETNPNAETAFFAPIGSDSGRGFELLQDNFGPGAIAPMNFVITPDNQNVWTQEFFDLSQSFIQGVVSATEIDINAFSSHTWLGGQQIPFLMAMAALDPASQTYNDVESVLYRQFAFQWVATSQEVLNQAAIIQIILPVDPSSPEARDLLHEMRDVASEVFVGTSTFGFTGQTAVNDSSITETFALFPLMILLVIIAIYALVGFMFRAVILPARLIATIALTISFIYGAATVIFEYDTFLNTIFPTLDGVSVTYWMVPVMSFSIILGLGMDYDIFTIERVRENVWNGLENDEAIAQGLDKTGRVITGAGVIMMIAFGGMMFSSSYILIQFGFVLSFAVFLDTFVVRSLLVPSVMSLADRFNWWPSMPPHQASDQSEKISPAITSGD